MLDRRSLLPHLHHAYLPIIILLTHHSLSALIAWASKAMASQSAFLSLQRELRDAIYETYFKVDGGIVCDSESLITSRLTENGLGANAADLSVADVLKRADGRLIDVDLIYTCKMVAEETNGIALLLRLNTITFSTATSTDIRVLAARFAGLVQTLDHGRQSALMNASYTMPERLNEKFKTRYPQFGPVLDRAREERQNGTRRFRKHVLETWSFGEAPSLHCAFAREAARAMSFLPVSRQRMDLCPLELPGRFQERGYMPDWFDPVARCSVEYWAIPSKDDMKSLVTRFKESGFFIRGIKRNADRIKFRLSAAAAAIHFLQFLPAKLRLQLRRVILNEDHEAVAEPACHALGLIPFCRENPLLRVQRRVDLWRNAFQPDRNYAANPERRYQPWARSTPWALDSRQISRNVDGWIVEALALGPAGMPAGSFSLLLDGQPVPQQCAQIFQLTVQRDAAWQEAWVEFVNRGILPEMSWCEKRGERSGWPPTPCYPGYVFENFQQALKDIADNKSTVECNFDIGDTWDIEAIIQEHRFWTLERWVGG